MFLLPLVSELIPLIALGYIIGRLNPQVSDKIIAPLIDFGIPISLIGLILKNGLDWRLFEALFMALLAIGILIILICVCKQNRKLLESRVLLLGSVFGNSGYLGIPVALAVLPNEALNSSIGYDLGATLLVWSLGPILLANKGLRVKRAEHLKHFFNAFANSPATKGLIGAWLIQLTPWREQISSNLWIPSKIVILLALIVVGIRLGAFQPKNLSNTRNFNEIVRTSLFIKLFVLPTLMLVLSKAFGLPLLMCSALVLQAATPTAISVLLLAEANGKEQNVAASLITWSTLLAVFTIPSWALFLTLQ